MRLDRANDSKNDGKSGNDCSANEYFSDPLIATKTQNEKFAWR